MVLPRSGGYWCDDGSDTAAAPADPSQTASCKLELDETARCYRRFFVGKVSDTLCSFLYYITLAWILCYEIAQGQQQKKERESEFCVRYFGVCYATMGFTDFTTAHRQLPSGVKGDSARTPGTWRLSLFFPPLSDGNNPRHADIYLTPTKQRLFCMYAIERESFRGL